MADNRGPWMIAVAIVLAAGIIVGGLLYMRAEDREREEACREWQTDVAAMADVTQMGRGEVGALLRDDRPEGCAIP